MSSPEPKVHRSVHTNLPLVPVLKNKEHKRLSSLRCIFKNIHPFMPIPCSFFYSRFLNKILYEDGENTEHNTLNRSLYNWMHLCMTYIPRRGHSRTAATPGDTVLNLLSWSAQTPHNSMTLLMEDTQIFANYSEGNFRMLCGVHYIVCLKF